MCINKLLFEFRLFGQSFGETENSLNQLLINVKPRKSYDYYILSQVNVSFNVLIRNNNLIIKELISTVDKLEKWNVNHAETFPIKADAIENMVFPALGIEAPKLEKESYQIIEFLKEIVNQDPDLKVVEVFKQKRKITYNNCNCELTENLINGTYIKTINIESENVKVVYNTLQELQIDSSVENVNYQKKLKQIIGMIPITNYNI